ncbi:hypothetical protein CORMATOL_02885 [Corynebacterium matruchotii ATCC 33806]|uniref:Uncharacterized protein n=1 Tax=Corynebacterium matruchotii ATCC 33806 TaxID=566549 RepID=C0E796_9CORY|nr:hypothetical protein CORMATOL_02885 [Corynebacterium matruchotii ATCC 33806]
MVDTPHQMIDTSTTWWDSDIVTRNFLTIWQKRYWMTQKYSVILFNR